MSEIVVKYQVTNEQGEVINAHSTYSLKNFDTVEMAQAWIDEEGENFTNACHIDSEMLGMENLSDDLLIVRVNGFPVTTEEVL